MAMPISEGSSSPTRCQGGPLEGPSARGQRSRRVIAFGSAGSLLFCLGIEKIGTCAVMFPRAVSQRAVAQAVRRRTDALPGAREAWESTGNLMERNTTGHAAPDPSGITGQAGTSRLLPANLHGSCYQLHLRVDSASPSRLQCLMNLFHSSSCPNHPRRTSTTDFAGTLAAGSAGVPWMTGLGSSRRSLNIFSVFNKEERDKAKERLKDELNRGYFDDFKELKETNGKVGGPALASLLPAAGAAQFPPLQTFTAHGQRPLLPLEGSQAIIFVSFRAGAQGMVDSWISRLLAPGAIPHSLPPMTQVSFVESGVLSLPLLRPLVLRMLTPPKIPSQAKPSAPSSTKTGTPLSANAPDAQSAGETSESATALEDVPEVGGREQEDSRQRVNAGQAKAGEVQSVPVEVVYAFGDTWSFRRSLRIRNKLTGYVFLVDKKGRVRWRGTGFSTGSEVQSLCNALKKLQDE